MAGAGHPVSPSTGTRAHADGEAARGVSQERTHQSPSSPGLQDSEGSPRGQHKPRGDSVGQGRSGTSRFAGGAGPSPQCTRGRSDRTGTEAPDARRRGSSTPGRADCSDGRVRGTREPRSLFCGPRSASHPTERQASSGLSSQHGPWLALRRGDSPRCHTRSVTKEELSPPLAQGSPPPHQHLDGSQGGRGVRGDRRVGLKLLLPGVHPGLGNAKP